MARQRSRSAAAVAAAAAAARVGGASSLTAGRWLNGAPPPLFSGGVECKRSRESGVVMGELRVNVAKRSQPVRIASAAEGRCAGSTRNRESTRRDHNRGVDTTDRLSGRHLGKALVGCRGGRGGGGRER